jgi:serine/threonine protein kinase
MGACPCCSSPGPLLVVCPRDGRYRVSSEALRACDGDPLLGRLVADRFVPMALRANGARTAVYEAFDRMRGERCIVKCARSTESDENHTLAALFAREAMILRYVGHPLVPDVRGVGSVEGSGPIGEESLAFAWIALDDAGRTLADSASELSQEQGAAVVAALREAVRRLHETNVVHGDLKPEHVVLSGRWETPSAHGPELALVDFGSALAPGFDGPRDGGSSAFGRPVDVEASAELDRLAVCRIAEWLRSRCSGG